MTTPNNNTGGDKMWSVTIEAELVPCVQLAAEQEGRKIANYFRWLALRDLRERGLIDENARPIRPAETPSDFVPTGA